MNHVKEPRMPLIDLQTLNAILNSVREQHGLTSDDALGDLFGVTGQAIYRWRRGEISRSALALATVLHARNCSTNS